MSSARAVLAELARLARSHREQGEALARLRRLLAGEAEIAPQGATSEVEEIAKRLSEAVREQGIPQSGDGRVAESGDRP